MRRARPRPSELGALTDVQLGKGLENTWVHAVGTVAARGVEYQRPLDSDTYRLAPSADNPRIWIEVRIPNDIEPEHYVAPNSFVGRLVPMSAAGVRHSAIPDAIEAALGKSPSSDAWLLIDGETPATTRWAIGLVGLFLGFAAFNLWGSLRPFGASGEERGASRPLLPAPRAPSRACPAARLLPRSSSSRRRRTASRAPGLGRCGALQP